MNAREFLENYEGKYVEGSYYARGIDKQKYFEGKVRRLDSNEYVEIGEQSVPSQTIRTVYEVAQ